MVLIGLQEFFSWSYMVLDGWTPFSAGTYIFTMWRFFNSEIKSGTIVLMVWAKMAVAFSALILWNWALLVLHIERISHPSAVYRKESSCFSFYFLVDTHENHREHTGNWQLFLMRGVCEAALHTKLSELLFSGLREGECILWCLSWQWIHNLWKDEVVLVLSFISRLVYSA